MQPIFLEFSKICPMYENIWGHENFYLRNSKWPNQLYKILCFMLNVTFSWNFQRYA